MKQNASLVIPQPASRARVAPGLAVLVVLLLPLCAEAGVKSEGEGAVNAPIALTQADNGGTVNVTLNGEFTVRLASYADGGYQWVITALNTAKLRNMAHAVDTSGCPQGSIGCSGDDVFTFKSIGTGQSTLALASRQSWNPDNPAATFSITIIATAAAEEEAEGEGEGEGEGEDENGCQRFLNCVGAGMETPNAPGGPGADAALLGAVGLFFIILSRKRAARRTVR